MRFHVLGPGSIGSLIAHHVRRSVEHRHAVVLLHKDRARLAAATRAAAAITVRSHGAAEVSTGFEHELSDAYHQPLANTANVSFPAQRAFRALPRRVDNTDALEAVFVTLKAHAVVPSLRLLLPRIRPSTTIVLLHNGMGVYEALLADLFRNPAQRPHLILTANTHAVHPVDNHYLSVTHTSTARSALAFAVAPDPRGRPLELNDHGRHALSLDALSSLHDPDAAHYASLRNTVAVLSSLHGLNPVWLPLSDLLVHMKRKLVVNSVINPLTAIMNCRNGDIAISPHTARICRSVCEEASLAFALQYNEHSKTPRPPALRPQLPLTPNSRAALLSRLPTPLHADALMKHVYRVATDTRHNISSMLQDIRNNRQTEIQYMNGYLIGLGRRHNLHMRATSTLANMVRLRQEIPLDLLLDLPPPNALQKRLAVSNEERMLRRAWTLVKMRKFKNTRYRFPSVHTRRVLLAKKKRAPWPERSGADEGDRTPLQADTDIDQGLDWQY